MIPVWPFHENPTVDQGRPMPKKLMIILAAAALGGSCTDATAPEADGRSRLEPRHATAAVVSHESERFTFYELETPLWKIYGSGHVSGVNKLGTVTGRTRTVNDRWAAFTSSVDGVLAILSDPTIEQSWGNDINEAGQIVGMARFSDGGIRGFLWEGEVVTRLGSLPGGFSAASAINEAGMVVGTSFDGVGRAVVWDPGAVEPVALSHGDFTGRTQAFAVSSDGRIAGWICPESCTAMYWRSPAAEPTVIEIPGLVQSFAQGVNSVGEVVGYGYTGEENVAFIWSDVTGAGEILELPESPAFAHDISDEGVVVGSMGAPQRGYAWSRGGVVDLGVEDVTFVELPQDIDGAWIGGTGGRIGRNGNFAFAWHLTDGNRPPSVSAGGPYEAHEGEELGFAGVVHDPHGDDVSLSWSFGDGAVAFGSEPVHVYIDNGTYDVVLTAADGLSESSAATTATIHNLPPHVTIRGEAQILSGDLAVIETGFNDQGVEDAPWSWSIQWLPGDADAGVARRASTLLSSSRVMLRPGERAVTVQVEDKDGGLGTATLPFTVLPRPIGLIVKPGDEEATAPINLRSSGLTPVALLSDDRFNASLVDGSSIAAGPAGAAPVRPGALEDADGDGLLDLMLHFQTRSLGLAAESTELCVSATTTEGIEAIGCAPVRLVPGRGRDH